MKFAHRINSYCDRAATVADALRLIVTSIDAQRTLKRPETQILDDARGSIEGTERELRTLADQLQRTATELAGAEARNAGS